MKFRLTYFALMFCFQVGLPVELFGGTGASRSFTRLSEEGIGSCREAVVDDASIGLEDFPAAAAEGIPEDFEALGGDVSILSGDLGGIEDKVNICVKAMARGEEGSEAAFRSII